MKKQSNNTFNISETDKTLRIKKYPENVTNVLLGDTIDLEIEVESNSSSAVKYRWQKIVIQEDGSIEYENIKYATNKKYSFIVNENNIDSAYRIYCTNGCSEVTAEVIVANGTISAPFNLRLAGSLTLDENDIEVNLGTISVSTNNNDKYHDFEIYTNDNLFYIDGNVLKNKFPIPYSIYPEGINVGIRATNKYNLKVEETFLINITQSEVDATNILKNTSFFPYNTVSYTAGNPCVLNKNDIEIWTIKNYIDICNTYYWGNDLFNIGPNNYTYKKEDLFIDLMATRSDSTSYGSIQQTVTLNSEKYVLYFDLTRNNDGDSGGNILDQALWLQLKKTDNTYSYSSYFIPKQNIIPNANSTGLGVVRYRIEFDIPTAGQYTISFASPENIVIVGNNTNYGAMVGRLRMISLSHEDSSDKPLFWIESPRATTVDDEVIVRASSANSTNIRYFLQEQRDAGHYVSVATADEVSGNRAFLIKSDFTSERDFRVVAIDELGNAIVSDVFKYADLFDEGSALGLMNPVETIPDNTVISDSNFRVADIITTDLIDPSSLSLSGNDADSFTIINDGLFLKTNVELNGITNPSLRVTVNATDRLVDTNTFEVDYFLTVSIHNEKPTFFLDNTVISIRDDMQLLSRYKVANINVVDDDRGSNVLSLSGNDADKFEILPTTLTSELYLKAGIPLNGEIQPEFSITITITDETTGESYSEELTINITAPNNPPSFLLENIISSIRDDIEILSPYRIADINIQDDGRGVNVLSLGNIDANLFEITDNKLYIKTNTELDGVLKSELFVTIIVTDVESGSYSQELIIQITAINKQPKLLITNIEADINDDIDTTALYRIADITVEDDGRGVNELSISGTDSGMFDIEDVGSTQDGAGTKFYYRLYLKRNTVLNGITKPQLFVTITLTDQELGDIESQQLIINVTAINKPPGLTLSNIVSSIQDNMDVSSRFKIANITINDDGRGTNTLSIGGADANFFELIGATELYLKSNVVLNGIEKPILNVSVIIIDNVLNEGQAVPLSISVLPINQFPKSITLTPILTSIPESQTSNGALHCANVRIEDDILGNNIFTIGGADASSFTLTTSVIGNLASIYFKLDENNKVDGKELLNARIKSEYTVSVFVTDPSFPAASPLIANYTLNITEVNQQPGVTFGPPAGSTAIVDSMREDESDYTKTLAQIDIVDDNRGSLEIELGGQHGEFFEIVPFAGGQTSNESLKLSTYAYIFKLKQNVVLNYALINQYNVTISISDPTATIFTKQFYSKNYTLTVLESASTPRYAREAVVSTEEGLVSAEKDAPNISLSSLGNMIVANSSAYDHPDGSLSDVGRLSAYYWNGQALVQMGDTIYGDRHIESIGWNGSSIPILSTLKVAKEGRVIIVSSQVEGIKLYYYNGTDWKKFNNIDIAADIGSNESIFSCDISSDAKTIAVGTSATSGNEIHIYKYNSVTDRFERETIDTQLKASGEGDNILTYLLSFGGSATVSLAPGGERIVVAVNEAFFNDGWIQVFGKEYTDGVWRVNSPMIKGSWDGESLRENLGYCISTSENARYIATCLNPSRIRVFARTTVSNTPSSTQRDTPYSDLGDLEIPDLTGGLYGNAVSISESPIFPLDNDDRYEPEIIVGNRNSSDVGVVRFYKWNRNSQLWDIKGIERIGDSENSGFGKSVSIASNGEYGASSQIINENESVTSKKISIFNKEGSVDPDPFSCWVNDLFQVGTFSNLERVQNVSINGESLVLNDQAGTASYYTHPSTSTWQLVRERTGVSNVCISDPQAIRTPYVVYSYPSYNANRGRVQINFGEQTVTLLDGKNDDLYFGKTISITGNGAILAVGFEKINGDGGVRFFRNSEIGNVDADWIEVAELIDSGNKDFASSLHISRSGNTVVVGNPNRFESGISGSGSVKIYYLRNLNNLDSSSLELVQVGNTITSGVLNGSAGHSVSLSDDGQTLAVGSPGINSGIGRTSIYRYKANPGYWQNIGNIDGSNTLEGFGKSVSLSRGGSIVAIGSPNYKIGDINLGRISCYSFIEGSTRFEGEWKHITGDIIGEEDGDMVGISVSLINNHETTNTSGDVNIIAFNKGSSIGVARFNNKPLAHKVGSSQQLDIDILGENSDNFGYDVSISDDGMIMAIAARRYVSIYQWDLNSKRFLEYGVISTDYNIYSMCLSGDGNILAVYDYYNNIKVYYKNGSQWVQKGDTIIYGTSTSLLGKSVIVNGITNTAAKNLSLSHNGLSLAVGFNDYSLGLGIVNIYDWSDASGSWTESYIHYSSNSRVGWDKDRFGTSVSMSKDGTTLAIGSPDRNAVANSDDNVGAVYVYKKNGDNWILFGDEIKIRRINSNDSRFGSCVSLSDDGLVVAISEGDALGGSNAVHIYRWNGVSWSIIGSPIYTQYSSRVGIWISLSGDGRTVAIRAKISAGELRKAFIFRWNGEFWEEIIEAESVPNDTYDGSLSLSADGSRLVVGQPGSLGNAAGLVRVFQINVDDSFNNASV